MALAALSAAPSAFIAALGAFSGLPSGAIQASDTPPAPASVSTACPPPTGNTSRPAPSSPCVGTLSSSSTARGMPAAAAASFSAASILARTLGYLTRTSSRARNGTPRPSGMWINAHRQALPSRSLRMPAPGSDW